MGLRQLSHGLLVLLLALAPLQARQGYACVAFNTHTVTLTGDPAQFSRLVDSKGGEQPALAWQGDPPGGHHRKGVLRFKPLADQTQVELRINGVGGAPTRSFRWQVQ